MAYLCFLARLEKRKSICSRYRCLNENGLRVLGVPVNVGGIVNVSGVG